MNRFFHTGDLGDIVAAMPIIRQVGGGVLVLGNHPKVLTREPMTKARFDFIAPLLAAQDYIKGVEFSDDSRGCKLNFANFRSATPMRGATLTDWQARALRITKVDMSPWIKRPGAYNGSVVVARSARYHNPLFDWKQLIGMLAGNISFVGLEAERIEHEKTCGRALQRTPSMSALDLATTIAGSRLFIGNQSLPCWIAMGMGHTLIQESQRGNANSMVLRRNARFYQGRINLLDASNFLKNNGVTQMSDTTHNPSESAKYLHLTSQYLTGNGLDLGSGGWPVMPRSIQVELPPDEFAKYGAGRTAHVPIHWHGDIYNLPFKDDTCDYVHASHLLEDFKRSEWPELFTEWMRVLKPGGHLVILVPEYHRWSAALRRGQPPNNSHVKPEPVVGEIGAVAESLGFIVVEDRLTNLTEQDYSILAVLRK